VYTKFVHIAIYLFLLPIALHATLSGVRAEHELVRMFCSVLCMRWPSHAAVWH
jgi:hypothetical protein